jgi:hypothetical protein
MILHVVGGDDFHEENARSVEHTEFFIERIRDTDLAPVYSFEDASQTKAQLERIAAGFDGFEVGAQAISRAFSLSHVGSSRDGAFFIFELTTNDPNVVIYSLIKYDYREAIEQAESERGSLLRRIVHAFVADKKAMQKSALVRIVGGVANSEISARDRVKVSPDIGDYFAKFLDVRRSRSNKELTTKAADVLRETLSAFRDRLPNNDVARAYRHAVGILRDRSELTEDAITEAILASAGNPQEETFRSEIQIQARRKMKSAKLEGLVFPPDLTVLRRPPIRRLHTTEGITIIYPDAAEGGTVDRKPREGGGEVITINTAQVTEDRVVREGSSSAT